MIQLTNAQMEQVMGGSDYVLCGIGVGVTAAIVFAMPEFWWAVPDLANATAVACVSGQ